MTYLRSQWPVFSKGLTFSRTNRHIVSLLDFLSFFLFLICIRQSYIFKKNAISSLFIRFSFSSILCENIENGIILLFFVYINIHARYIRTASARILVTHMIIIHGTYGNYRINDYKLHVFTGITRVKFLFHFTSRSPICLSIESYF